jgi:kynureninase
MEDIEAAIHEHREELALVLWSGVQYYTGQVFDIAAICKLAHAYNIPVGFDLAHAAGNIPLKLHEWDLDFACFCNYKYLNAGPGAIATAFIHKRYHSRSYIPRMAGWWGNEKASRFLMRDHFVPEANASGWQLSTPSILLYACLKASIDIFDKAGMDALHVKRRSMHAYFQYLYNQKIVQRLAEKIRIITPAEFSEPGCQFSLQVPEKGRQVFEALGSCGFMVDWREPEVIRLAPVPLYNRYEEIWHFVNALEEIIVEVQ